MIKPYFQLIAYDGDQSYLRQTRKRRSRSFVTAFLGLHYGWTNFGSISINDISASSRSITSAYTPFTLNATSPGRGASPIMYMLDTDRSDASHLASDAGIVVGTGTTAVAPTDYALVTQIEDGVTAGTLEYFPCGGTIPTTTATEGSFTLERLFRNSSGGSITVNEVGLFAVAISTGTVGYPFCVLRDLVSPGFAVADGEYMRVIYTITVSA